MQGPGPLLFDQNQEMKVPTLPAQLSDSQASPSPESPESLFKAKKSGSHANPNLAALGGGGKT